MDPAERRTHLLSTLTGQAPVLVRTETETTAYLLAAEHPTTGISVARRVADSLTLARSAACLGTCPTRVRLGR